MHIFSSGRLALAVASAIATLTATTAAAAIVEEVIVTATPIRDSQQAAIDAKRDAVNFIEVISADTIGRFPDQNLADSLGRVPGLAIERDQGQARYINLRGTPFRYTSIAFDGIDVHGAENGRVPRFDSFPSVITRKIEVNKAVLPSMTGEAVAGHINIETFSPFDREGFALDADLGMGEQDLGGGDVEKASLRLSWSNENFGIVGFGSNNSRDQVTDNREYDLDRDLASGEIVVNELDFRSYFVNREDEALGGRIEYRGEGALSRLFVSSLYTEFSDFEQRNQYVFGFVAPEPGTTGTDRVATITRLLQDGSYVNSTFTNTLGADFSTGNWAIEARYNRTETEFDIDLPIPYSVGAVTLASYDISDLNDPIVTLAGDLGDAQFARDFGLRYGQAMDVDADKFKLDASRAVTVLGRDGELRIGAQYDTREADGYVISLAFGRWPDIDIASFRTDRPWTANASNSIGATYYDNPGLINAWAAAGGLGPINAPAENLVAIDEDILAAYGMLTTEYQWGSLVLGARIEQTDYRSAGNLDGLQVEVEDDFTDFLPSAHINIDLADDMKLRFSATSGVNRPTYSEWRAAAAVDVANRTVDGGNPSLKAEKAFGLDISYEWYFAPASLLSLGAFYRDIDDVIYADASTIDGGLYVPEASGEAWEFVGAVNGKDGSISGLELNLIAQAAELLPSPFDGLGFSANVTVTDSEFTALSGEKFDLPGTSDLVYNASIFYEKYDVSLRVNYQYRDEWISPIEDPSEFWGEQQRVDFSASYQLPVDIAGATVSLYANANNLTDETDERFAGNGTINQSESYGRHYLLGVRVNY
jgi:TonB-dependent receptor